MRAKRPSLLQHAVVLAAVLRGLGEFVSLQAWRLRERRSSRS